MKKMMKMKPFMGKESKKEEKMEMKMSPKDSAKGEKMEGPLSTSPKKKPMAMKKGGCVKKMAKGGIAQSTMAKMGRNMAKAKAKC